MPRVVWNAPETRFFETGLDRGMLYPRKPIVVGELVGFNEAKNPRGARLGSLSQEVKKNTCTTPKSLAPTGENNTYWTRTTSVPAPGHPVSGILATRFKPTVPNSAGATMASVNNNDGLGNSAQERYVGTYVRANQPARVIMYLSGSPSATNVDVRIPANEWVWVNTQRKAAGTMFVLVERADGTQVTTADEVLFAGVVSSQASADQYFDGDTPDTSELTYSWFGTANNSLTVVTGLNPADWTQVNGSAVTRPASGGVNYRSSVTGTGMYMTLASPATVGWHYAARFEISRIPGETTSGPVRIALWDGDSYIGEQNGVTTYFNTEHLPADGSPMTLYINATAPSSTNTPTQLIFATDPGAKTSFHVDYVMLRHVEVAGMAIDSPAKEPYFDGDSESNAYQYSWSPTPNTTTSVKRELLSAAVPWNGLTSVEESGGEAARAYYVDGRPFLFLPMPKEYAATLNAYTYPDEFAEMMGLLEATDGMYLDSQPGQAFDLCYRTLIGNASEGQGHGYKIHLVYNATVTPGSVNYETLSDSVNPSTMSWEIQAVPVRVEGFRPTAHIVIDTRHMDERKIEAIEAMLYGSEDEVPIMPSPQKVFDLLNYGGAIIVTANGDGTFDVEGSYENVYLVGDGEFRVDNVDGQDNGDGTFTISTTEG